MLSTMMVSASPGPSLDLAQALIGLPVAVVVVALALLAWRLNAKGELLTGREHRTMIAQIEHRLAEAERERDEAKAETRYWQSISLRALNVSEAALGRREGGG
jgi:hypothetical protein